MSDETNSDLADEFIAALQSYAQWLVANAQGARCDGDQEFDATGLPKGVAS